MKQSAAHFSEKTSTQRMLRSMLLTFFRQFLSGAVSLGSILLIGRILGPQGAGSYAMALLLPTILSSLLNLGLASSNVYFIASERFQVAVVWAVSRNLAAIMAVIGVVLGGLLVGNYSSTFFPGIAASYLWIAIFVFPTSLLWGMVTSVFQGLQNFRAYNILVFQQPIFLAGGLVFLWIAGSFELHNVLIITAISHLAALCGALWYLRRSLPLFARVPSETNYLRPAISYGYKVHLTNLVGMLIYRSDIFLVNLFLGPVAAGLYSVAARLAEQLWIVSQAVSTVLLPRLSSMQKDEKGLRMLTPLISRLVFTATGIASIVVALAATPLVDLLFGDAFSGAVPVLLVFLPGVVMLSSGRVLANDLAARGLVSTNFWLSVMLLFLNIIGSILLIPLFGLIGAAISTSLSYAVNLLLRLAIQRRLTLSPCWSCIVPKRSDLDYLFLRDEPKDPMKKPLE